MSSTGVDSSRSRSFDEVFFNYFDWTWKLVVVVGFPGWLVGISFLRIFPPDFLRLLNGPGIGSCSDSSVGHLAGSYLPFPPCCLVQYSLP